ASRGVDQLDQREVGEPPLVWILARLLCCRQGIVVSRQTVAEEGGRPQRERESHPLAVPPELLGPRRDGSGELVLATAERCDCELSVRRDDATVGRLGERVRFLDERRGPRDVAAEEAHADTGAEGERKLGERTRLACGSDLPHRQ